jgi:hypothetical protein
MIKLYKHCDLNNVYEELSFISDFKEKLERLELNRNRVLETNAGYGATIKI